MEKHRATSLYWFSWSYKLIQVSIIQYLSVLHYSIQKIFLYKILNCYRISLIILSMWEIREVCLIFKVSRGLTTWWLKTHRHINYLFRLLICWVSFSFTEYHVYCWESFFCDENTKNLCNGIGDEWLHNKIMVYIEKVSFAKVDNEDVLQNNQNT